jgi:hypothetical protein
MERETTSGGNAELPPQRPGTSRWRSLQDLAERCGGRCAGELDFAEREARFVYRVEQIALLLAFLANHLEGPTSDALCRGRQLLDLARELLDQAIAEAEAQEASGGEDGGNAVVFAQFCEASGSFLEQVTQLPRILAAADDCLTLAERERRSELGAFQVLARSAIDQAKRAIADADTARNLLSASLR